MTIKAGIVGLPNVGKSTLFNALTQTMLAESANYPFCTIEPNVGQVEVKDSRLKAIAEISQSEKIIYNRIIFTDIAGLVKGASKGEGLGNQFLSNIRETDAIVHLVRCFEDSNITHVNNQVDPLSDIEVIETELMLSDLESIERRLVNLEKKVKLKDEKAVETYTLLTRIKEGLEKGIMAYFLKLTPEEQTIARLSGGIITLKPFIYVCNVNEDEINIDNAHVKKVQALAKERQVECLKISCKIEQEIAMLPESEQNDMLALLQLKEKGLDSLIKASYKLLGLETFFTAGPKEARAWSILKNTKAPQAAGVIHTDFEKGFIKAQTIGYEDYLTYKGELGAKTAGKARDEGRDYIVKDGDILLFKFNN